MDCRRLTVHKDHRGCVLLDGERYLASCRSVSKALELARTLAAVHTLRRGPPVIVELRHYGQRPRPVRID